MELTSENVTETLKRCLFDDKEDKKDFVEAEGITLKVGLHPSRLEEEKENIFAMLAQLPDEFKASKGGGWSFLNACNTQSGKQWTGLHQNIDELVCLGKAIGKLSITLPRDFWLSLPGGMPYFVINDK